MRKRSYLSRWDIAFIELVQSAGFQKTEDRLWQQQIVAALRMGSVFADKQAFEMGETFLPTEQNTFTLAFVNEGFPQEPLCLFKAGLHPTAASFVVRFAEPESGYLLIREKDFGKSFSFVKPRFVAVEDFIARPFAPPVVAGELFAAFSATMPRYEDKDVVNAAVRARGSSPQQKTHHTLDNKKWDSRPSREWRQFLLD